MSHPDDLLEEYRSRLRKAMTRLGELESALAAASRVRDEPIAIVGIGCRFPLGVRTPEAFFELLLAGTDAITEAPPDRAALQYARDPELHAPRWGGFVRDVDRFDAAFFGVSPREAAALDPQQRLLLEVTWEALERAGVVPEHVGARVGTFIGVTTHDYLELSLAAGPAARDIYTMTGNGHCFVAGRLAYALGLAGPALTVDTACSSSLVAVHLACHSLRLGECDVALAGGVNLVLSHTVSSLLADSQALAPDGRCKAFDAAADGFVRGEGCGVIVLKRLADALRDRDDITAVIRGSAVNQDGRSTGLTAPNVRAQESLLRQALASARLPAAAVGYIETHGTGTALGDPIEFDALQSVLGAPRPGGAPCILGAVKTNVGHLEAAAGITGLIKAALSLRRGVIPGNLHFKALNPRISLADTPFVLPTAPVPWPASATPRIAGISAFGLSGTNAHVLLTEPPATNPPTTNPPTTANPPTTNLPPTATANPPTTATTNPPTTNPPTTNLPTTNPPTTHPPTTPDLIVPLSAKTPAALTALATALATHLAGEHPPALPDLAYTTGTRRAHFTHRLAVVAANHADLAAALTRFARGEHPPDSFTGVTTTRPRIVFVCSGQGAQWPGMGRELHTTQPVFRAALEACDAALRPHLTFSLLPELFADATTSRLDHTAIAQPALWAMQVALAALLRSWGVTPDAVLGHSVGEIAAAHLADALTLADAARLVATRGALMQPAHGLGRMAAVTTDLATATAALHDTKLSDRVAIAAINDPTAIVLSGDPAALDTVLATLTRHGVRSRDLRVDYAFHGPQMAPLGPALATALADLTPAAPTLPLYSTVTGARITAPLDATYWARNLADPVRFADAITAAAAGNTLFLELGPHPVLAANIRECLTAAGVDGHVLPSLRRNHGPRSLHTTLAQLWALGVDVTLAPLLPPGARAVPLPTYPWQHERHWISTPLAPRDDATTSALRSLVDAPDAASFAASLGLGDTLPPDALPIVAQVLAALQSRRDAARDADELQTALHELVWRETPRPRPDPTSASGLWILRGGATTGDALAAALTAAGAQVVRADTTSDPATWLAAQPGPIRGLVHFADPDPAHPALVDHACAALTWIQAALTAQTQIWLVTRGAQALAADVPPALAHAPLWGLGRTLALEHPEAWGALLDLDPAGTADDDATWLTAELLARDGEDGVALRDGRRHVARLAPRTPRPTSPAPLQLDPDAAYLVTGALGDDDLALARWLSERGARHLWLLGARPPAPLPADLSVHALAVAPPAPTGPTITVLTGDLGDPAVITTTLATITARGLPLRGVFHAAGAPDDGVLLQQDPARLARVLATKLSGAWHLHHATRHLLLDHFVLFSSVAGVHGQAGQASYAAACAALGALAQVRRAAGLPALCVDWCASRTLPAAVVTGALTRLLAEAATRVAVVPGTGPARWATTGAANLPLLAELTPRGDEPGPRPAAAAPPDLAARLLAAPAGARRSLLADHVQREVERVLGFPPGQRVSPTQGLFDLGADSLMALELKNRLQRALGRPLVPTLVFDHPTIDALSDHLAGLFTDPTPPAPTSDTKARLIDEVAGLSEDELAAMIDRELAGLLP